MKHAKDLSETLRENDKQEAIRTGQDPKKAVFFAYRHSLLKRTGLVDGRVAAMWGVGGSFLGIGQPYLITGTEVENVSSFSFARVYKNEVEIMKSLFPVLENYVDSRYEGAIRMLKIAGFTLTGPYPMYPHGDLFLKFRLEN